MERRKLFSATPAPRRKLFSDQGINKVGETTDNLKAVQCNDCGYTMTTNASTTALICPKCGGKRFNVVNVPFSPENTPEPVKVEEKGFSRRSLFNDEAFEKEFSVADNKFEEKLKEFSGKVVPCDEVEKIFSEETPESLVEKGFAEYENDDNLKIHDTAFLQNKLFSKLVISITKTLELDPSVASMSRESIIDGLASKGNLAPKSIVLLKKAHNIPLPAREFTESDKEETVDSWAEDSGICNDLRLEFGDSDMGIKEFTKLLDERYPDAPEGIINYLIDKGVVTIQGNQVSIFK